AADIGLGDLADQRTLQRGDGRADRQVRMLVAVAHRIPARATGGARSLAATGGARERLDRPRRLGHRGGRSVAGGRMSGYANVLAPSPENPTPLAEGLNGVLGFLLTGWEK